MNFVNKKYYSSSINPNDLEREIINAFPLLREISFNWFNENELKKIQILYSLVDYWNEVFEFSEENRVFLMRIASLTFSVKRSRVMNNELRRCPVGIVQIDNATEQNLLPLLLLNLVIGNVVLIKNYSSQETILKIMANSPCPGLLNFFQTKSEVNLNVDKLFEASDFVYTDDVLERLSSFIDQNEWEGRRANLKSDGY